MSGSAVDGGRTAAPGQDTDGRKVGKLPWIVDKDLAIRDANGFVIAKPNLNLPEEELERMAAFIAGAANATAGGPCNPAKLRVALEKMATWANEDGCECCVAQREQMAKEALEDAGKVDEDSRDKGAVTRVDRVLAKVRKRACEIKGNLGPKNLWDERVERADELLKIAAQIEVAASLDRYYLECCWEPGSVANIVRQMIDTAHDLQHGDPCAAENIGYFARQLLKTHAGKEAEDGNS